MPHDRHLLFLSEDYIFTRLMQITPDSELGNFSETDFL